MDDTQSTRTRTRTERWRRGLLAGLAVFLVLAVLLPGVTQTGWFRSFLRHMIERRVGEALNARLTIESLDGSLFTSFRAGSIVLARETDTLLTVDRIEAAYAFRPLLSRRLILDSLVVEHPFCRLRQSADGGWNVAELGSGAREAPDTSASGGLPLAIDARQILLRDGVVAIESASGIIPGVVDDITLDAAVLLDDSRRNLSMNAFSFASHEPDFTLRRLSFSVSQDSNGTAVRNLSLRTARNEVQASANMSRPDSGSATAAVRADSLDLGEFDFVLGEFQLGLSPRIVMDLELRGDTASVSVSLGAGEQHIGLKGRISGIDVRESAPAGRSIGYALHIDAANVAPGEWVDAAGIVSRLNAAIDFTGSGYSPSTASVECSGRIYDTRIREYVVDSLLFAGRYDRGDAVFTSRVYAPVGRSDLSCRLRGLLKDPSYDIDGSIRKLDLARIAADTTLRTNINGRLSVRGAGLAPEEMRAEMLLALENSSLTTYRMDSLFARARIRNREVRLDTFSVAAAGIGVAGGGRFSFRDNSFAAHGGIRVDDPAVLGVLVPFDTIDANGSISASVAGRADSLAGRIDPVLSRIVLDGISVDTLSGMAEFERVAGHPPSVRSNWNAAGFTRGALRLDRISAGITMAGDSMSVNAGVSGPDRLRLDTRAVVSLPASSIALQGLEVAWRTLEWHQIEPPARISRDSTGYHISGFRFAAAGDNTGPRARLSIDGTYALRGAHDLHVAGNDIPVATILAQLDTSRSVTGMLSFRTDITGDASDPTPAVTAVIRNGSAMGIGFDSLSTRFAYARDSLDISARLDFDKYPPLNLSGYLPVHLPPGDGRAILPADKPLSVQVTVDSLPLGLARLYTKRPIEEIAGFAACSLAVHNTISAPAFSGHAIVRCERLRMPQYGIAYRDIGIDLLLEGDRIVLDRLGVKREEGSITASGHAEWRGGLRSGAIESMSLDLRADRFYLARHRHYDLQISGDVRAAADADSARFGGTVTIHRSRLYLPVITGRSKSAAATDPDEVSMLVAAMHKKSDRKTAPADTTAARRARAAFTANALYKRLRGTLKLQLPRNTWIVSPEMRMELQGSLDIVKERPDPELFGSISVRRGYYELYGKRFRIVEGTLFFEGGTAINPRLALSTLYQFRDPNRNQRQLVLKITGTAKQPVLNFTLDDTEIPEGDAMAFILFGRSFDSLTQGQRGTVAQSSQNGGVASHIAAGFLSSQLEKTLGRSLELDVFEIKAQDDWGGGAFEVGKYLTNDLYVSYESGFGVTVDNEVPPRKVMLEYELRPRLFFRLIEGDTRSSGFDLIFRLKND